MNNLLVGSELEFWILGAQVARRLFMDSEQELFPSRTPQGPAGP